MIRGNRSPGAASSNRSSDEAASRHGSPETKLTAFSPEDVRMKSLLDHGAGIGLRSGELLAYANIHKPAPAQDPFMATQGVNSRIRLSPTASPFTPASYVQRGSNGDDPLSAYLKQHDPTMSNIGYLAANSVPETPFTPGGSLARNSPPRFGPIGPGNFVMPTTYAKQEEQLRSKMSYLTATSEPETPFTPNGSLTMNAPARFGPIGEPYVPAPIQIMYCQIGAFDKVNRSRAFVIEGAATDLAYLSIVNLFDRHQFSTLKGPILTELGSHGRIYAGFTDSRDCQAALAKIQTMYPHWYLQPLTAREFASKHDPAHVGSTSDFEGYIFASVYYNGNNPGADERVISHNFKDILEKFGDIKAFRTIQTEQNHVVDFLVEFYDTRAAENVASTLNGNSVDDCILEIKLYKPDIVEAQYLEYEHQDNSDYGLRQPSGRRDSVGHHYVELSPTGRSTLPLGDSAADFTWTRKNDNGYTYRSRHEYGRRGEPRANNQNYVDIEKIRLGLDVRTTIMLRNIPNKIDQVMLKDIVDETSFGKYDFMYLRIDFANNCNVGYAFINFEDPIDIIAFANARAGRTWNCFNSDKIAEISYATIQGRDCLVQKFRNSSVMLEHPSFRPKLFYTGNGPLAGTEEVFPKPDNPSKMRRSVENAEHVGLFAPRVGQQYRDEQRRRRSQYDRGTTAAEHEAYCPRSYHPRRMTNESNRSNSFAPISHYCDYQYHH